MGFPDSSENWEGYNVSAILSRQSGGIRERNKWNQHAKLSFSALIYMYLTCAI